jgi:uncharacterized protein
MAAGQNQYALITGATSGIGYELAKLFAKEQYNLVIVARDETELSKTATELSQEFGIQVETVANDLMKREAPFDVYESVKAKGITIEVLVNNAAQGQYGLFVDTDINRELDIIQLNIGAYTALMKLYLQEMVSRKSGKILNVASVASKLPGPWQAVYHATKAYVLSLTESVRTEVKDTGVIITALMPGPTDTDFFNKADMEESKIVQEGSLADPAQVAQDGFDALMAGDDKVVSGLKNKVQVAASNLIPDEMLAKNMEKQQRPSTK